MVNAPFEILKGHNCAVKPDFLALLCCLGLTSVIAPKIANIGHHKTDTERAAGQRQNLMQHFPFAVTVFRCKKL